MSLAACAALVERGDPDRFRAAMAAPVAARAVLFPLYALNIEVSRAPWLTEEPMIAEMRLQWWRDVLEEIAAGTAVRAHEVSTALADVLDTEAARALDRLVAARRWDIYRDPFEDEAEFNDYLGATAGELMWQAARLLGVDMTREQAVRRFAQAVGLSRYLQAVPELEARGRIPLLDGRADAIKALAAAALPDAVPPALPSPPRAALLEGWMAHPILNQAARTPERVSQGTLGLSPIRQRWRLLRWS